MNAIVFFIVFVLGLVVTSIIEYLFERLPNNVVIVIGSAAVSLILFLCVMLGILWWLK
jgi:hypothetical protein